jgi:hypothetical protein
MMMMMITFTSIKNFNKRVSQNLYSIRFYKDQPNRHKYKKISMIIRNKGSINDNEADLFGNGTHSTIYYPKKNHWQLIYIQYTSANLRIVIHLEHTPGYPTYAYIILLFNINKKINWCIYKYIYIYILSHIHTFLFFKSISLNFFILSLNHVEKLSKNMWVARKTNLSPINI